jgi:hypothetical protein
MTETTVEEPAHARDTKHMPTLSEHPRSADSRFPAPPFFSREDAGSPTVSPGSASDRSEVRDAAGWKPAQQGGNWAARTDRPKRSVFGNYRADALFQPHRLADLAAFYRAFALEIADDAGERPDHLCVELEFMAVLAAKEAWALEHQLDADALAVVRDAQKKFLREHLGRWTPAFTRRLEREAGPGPLAALARFTREFVLAECGVVAGNEDLLLRPVDETAESLCATCGITALPPGALQTT